MGVEEYDSTLYQELVGSLLYLTIIHFNIKSSIEICSKFIHHLQLSHLLAEKIILSSHHRERRSILIFIQLFRCFQSLEYEACTGILFRVHYSLHTSMVVEELQR
uniref:Uncharacterized protein n=2 Tax=Physcomitrium patens TaxID=3218 RepID=A0A7I4BKN3_PHYPA